MIATRTFAEMGQQLNLAVWQKRSLPKRNEIISSFEAVHFRACCGSSVIRITTTDPVADGFGGTIECVPDRASGDRGACAERESARPACASIDEPGKPG